MLFLSLLALGLAIANFYLSRKVVDDIDQVLVVLVALICLLLSLCFAPWQLKLLILLALLVFPGRRRSCTPACAQLCVAQKRCLDLDP